MNLGQMHRRNVKLFPNRTAIIEGDRRITFGDMDNRVNRMINALLARGLKKGDRISMLAKNCSQLFEFYGAAEKGGFVAVPLNFRLKPDELAVLINDSGPRVLFVEQEYFPAINEIRDRCPTVEHYFGVDATGPGYGDYESLLELSTPEDAMVQIDGEDVAYIIYTSGTTGLPRGAMLTHSAQLENAKNLAIELDVRPGDTYLGVMPFYHVGGKCVSLLHYYRGAANLIMRDFDPEGMLRLIQDHRVTSVQVVPTMIAFMLDLPNVRSYDTSSLRTIFYASAPMPVALLRRAIDVFGLVFYQAYGQTESGPVSCVLRREDHRPDGTEAEVKRLGACGREAQNVEVRVVAEDGAEVKPGEVGEIIVRSVAIMKGYWNKPEMTAQSIREGWLYTGDMATVDEEGYIFIVDRKKDMIISGGENIYPREIEEVLYKHPAVLEASVIGVPDEKWGEAVKAVIVLKSGATATEAEIIEHCKGLLASYKKPKSVDFVPSLPKTPTGKILKRDLRIPYWQERNRQI